LGEQVCEEGVQTVMAYFRKIGSHTHTLTHTHTHTHTHTLTHTHTHTHTHTGTHTHTHKHTHTQVCEEGVQTVMAYLRKIGSAALMGALDMSNTNMHEVRE